MMKKLILLSLLIIFSISLLSGDGEWMDMSYLFDFTWKVIYKCDDDCEIGYHWMYCRTICFSQDGKIYNRTCNKQIGEWYQDTWKTFRIEIMCCNNISGYFKFMDTPTMAMEGMGTANLPTQKVIKMFLVKECAIK